VTEILYLCFLLNFIAFPLNYMIVLKAAQVPSGEMKLALLVHCNLLNILLVKAISILDVKRLPQYSLQVQLEPTTSWGILRRDIYGPSKYTGLLQATKDILREEGLPVSALPLHTWFMPY
jgi:hypothetical protein